MTGEKRTRVACVSCREVKRKCDGNHPCDTCQRYNLQCHYAAKPETTPVSPPSKKVKTTPKPAVYADLTVQRSLAANSGFRFLRQLVRDINPVDAPKVQLTAWNVGSRFPSGTVYISQAVMVTELISQEQMVTLANVYFDKIDPCYSFIERGHLFQTIQARWTLTQMPRAVDAMLCGVAACGSYFSKIHGVPVEPQLVGLAKSILDESNDIRAVDTNILIAWVCRTCYLRWTSDLQAAWLSSCNTMHNLELAGLHRNNPREDGTNGTRSPSSGPTPHTRRRLFGVAQHLNTWISYDFGLTRVSLHPPVLASDPLPSGQYTDKLLALLPASVGLDPNETQDDETLRSALEHVISKRDTQPPLIMAQTNYALCILRRLSSLNNLRHSGDRTLDASLRFLSKALAAARQMIVDDTPWHHLANVPFQILCLLLAIDTPASLRMLNDAMQTLLSVAAAYDTQTLRDATNTAHLLLSLHRKRRVDDLALLDNILGTSGARSNSVTSSEPVDPDDWPVPNDTEIAWIHDLMSEIPSLQHLQDVDLLSMMNTNAQYTGNGPS